jgi:hypothetical protein
MAWIESHQALGRHPKVRRLARALNVTVPAAIGHLHLLWWWCLDYAEDGDVTAVRDDLGEAALWDGSPEAFVAALEAAGFLDATADVDGPRLVIHDWDDYAGRLIEQRRQDAERARQWRSDRKNGTHSVRAASADRTDTESVAFSVTVPTVPYPTVPTLPTGPDRGTTTRAGAREVGAAAPTIPVDLGDAGKVVSAAPGPPPPPDPATLEAACAVWNPVRDRLRSEMARGNHDLYITPCSPLGIADGELVLAVGRFGVDETKRFVPQMLRALADIPDAPRDVRLVAGP